MQQKRDDIDELIIDSSVEIEAKGNYNYKLLSKMNTQKKYNINVRQKNVAAISLIMAGFMLMFIYTTDIKYKVTNLEFQVKTSISAIKYNFNFENIFLGE
jgi:hypothetical protein